MKDPCFQDGLFWRDIDTAVAVVGLFRMPLFLSWGPQSTKGDREIRISSGGVEHRQRAVTACNASNYIMVKPKDPPPPPFCVKTSALGCFLWVGIENKNWSLVIMIKSARCVRGRDRCISEQVYGMSVCNVAEISKKRT